MTETDAGVAGADGFSDADGLMAAMVTDGTDETDSRMMLDGKTDVVRCSDCFFDEERVVTPGVLYIWSVVDLANIRQGIQV